MNNRKLETFLYSFAGVAAVFLILIALNFILGLGKARVDLTAEKLYTLSAGTKAILAKLDTPVRIRLYYSQREQQMPVGLKTYAQRVEKLISIYLGGTDDQGSLSILFSITGQNANIFGTEFERKLSVF